MAVSESTDDKGVHEEVCYGSRPSDAPFPPPPNEAYEEDTSTVSRIELRAMKVVERQRSVVQWCRGI